MEPLIIIPMTPLINGSLPFNIIVGICKETSSIFLPIKTSCVQLLSILFERVKDSNLKT